MASSQRRCACARDRTDSDADYSLCVAVVCPYACLPVSLSLSMYLCLPVSLPACLLVWLQWLLLGVLSALSPVHLSASDRATMTTAMVFFLESVGLWEWALFVASRLNGDTLVAEVQWPVDAPGTILAKELLQRNVDAASEQQLAVSKTSPAFN